METKLTIKQSLFVSAYCSNGFNGAQAAITAGYSEKTAKAIAQENLTKPYLKEAVEAYTSQIAFEHRVTADSLMLELEEARVIALGLESPQTSAAISATMGKAKLAGLDKQLVDVTSSDGSMSPKGFNDFYSTVTDDDGEP